MTETIKGLWVFGYGGHARSVADVALSCGIPSLVFEEPDARDEETFLGFPIVRNIVDELPEGWRCFAASGDGYKRALQVEHLLGRGLPLATVISPTATVGVGASIGQGCFLGHHAHVGPLARIGRSCILNTGSIVDHDSTVGDFTHVSVNTTVAGGCSVGDFCFLGAGSTLIDERSIGDKITLGAGAVVVKSISAPGVYVGCPAVKI